MTADVGRPGRRAGRESPDAWWQVPSFRAYAHRRLIADFAVLARGAGVRHLHHDGRRTGHVAAVGARLSVDGLLVYDLIEPAR